MELPEPIKYWTLWSPSRKSFSRYTAELKLVTEVRARLENDAAERAGEAADWAIVRVEESYHADP